jgi:hypothetical protein
MTLQRYEKKYSDTFSECDLSQTKGEKGRKLFLTRPNTQNFLPYQFKCSIDTQVILAGAVAY